MYMDLYNTKRWCTRITILYRNLKEYKRLDEANACPNQTATPVTHASGSALSPITLHTGERILDVPWLKWRSGFGGLDKQRAHGKRHLSVGRIFTAAFADGGIKSRIELAFAQERRCHVVLSEIRLLERLFDVQCRDR